MKKKIQALIPEFELIKDEKLKENVISVFAKAVEVGGWKVEDLARIPFTLQNTKSKASFLDHTRSVALISHEMEKVMWKLFEGRVPIDHDVLLAGALLHDVGKLLEYAEKDGKFVLSDSGRALRHPVSGVYLCAGEGIPEKVLHVIAAHSKEGEAIKRSVEAILVSHADFAVFESFL